MTWSCTSRVDIADGETLRLAKRLGCWQVLYGVESGSQRILDFYDKRITAAQSARALELTKDAGLQTKGIRDGDHWIVMEYVSGKGLEQEIAERPAGMPPAEIEPWLEGIAAAIASK